MTPAATVPAYTAAQAIRAQAATWSPDGRLAAIDIDAGGYRGDISSAVVAAELSMTVDQVTQLTLTVEDPGFRMVHAGVFARRSRLTYGGTQGGGAVAGPRRVPRRGDPDFAAAAGEASALQAAGAKTAPRLPTARPLIMELGGCDLGPGDTGRGAVTARYRPRGIQKLKRRRQVLSVNGASPDEVVFLMCLRVGLELKAKRAAKRLQVYTARGENHWKAIRRWAQELGYLAFESAGTLYFGPPTWLVKHLPHLTIDWADEKNDRTDGLIGMPVCTRSENTTPPVTVALEVVADLGERIRPGMALDLAGVPTFKGRYLVTSCTGGLGGDADVWQVEAATAVDPAPEPPDDPRAATAAQVVAFVAYLRALQLAAALAYIAALSGAGGGGPGGPYPGNLREWTLESIRLTGVPMSWLEPLMRRAMQESGGNPRAINNWDSNAAKGTPSKGLMQCIDPTFNAYHLPGMTDIWNPVHNMCAAIRYIIARYGTVFNLPSGGY